MPGRRYAATTSTNYRYGFNGKENDNEVKGEGNQQDYGMRIYDTRLVRFLSVDPITADYPELTPYQFASNSPISGIDMDGLEYVMRINPTNDKDPMSGIKGAADIIIGTVVRWFQTGHAVGKNNYKIADEAQKADIKDHGSSEITAKTKALVYIGGYWYNGGVNSFVNPIENAKDAKKDFQNGNYLAGTLGVLAIIPGLQELKILKYAGKYGKCELFAAEYMAKFEKNIIKSGGTIKKFEINIGKDGLIGTAEKGMADNGMHQFMEIVKDGKSMIVDNMHPEGMLKEDYLKAIAGKAANETKIISGTELLQKYTKEIK
jgi:RHS repeat-associated protein